MRVDMVACRYQQGRRQASARLLFCRVFSPPWGPSDIDAEEVARMVADRARAALAHAMEPFPRKRGDDRGGALGAELRSCARELSAGFCVWPWSSVAARATRTNRTA